MTRNGRTVMASAAVETPIAAGAPKRSAEMRSSGIAAARPSSNKRALSERIVARCALGDQIVQARRQQGPQSAGTSDTASINATVGIDGKSASRASR